MLKTVMLSHTQQQTSLAKTGQWVCFAQQHVCGRTEQTARREAHYSHHSSDTVVWQAMLMSDCACTVQWIDQVIILPLSNHHWITLHRYIDIAKSHMTWCMYMWYFRIICDVCIYDLCSCGHSFSIIATCSSLAAICWLLYFVPDITRLR